jgi:uncharacterized protein
MVILYWCLVALMALGVVGAFIPGLPGTSIILAAIIAWGLVKGFSVVLWAVISAVVVLLLCLGIDFLAGYLGAQKAGASNWGQVGAIVGMIAGFLGLLPAVLTGIPILGLFIGAFIGAVIGEYINCKDLQKSVKAGIGIVVGSVIGSLLQGLLAIVPVIIFIITTWDSLSTL